MPNQHTSGIHYVNVEEPVKIEFEFTIPVDKDAELGSEWQYYEPKYVPQIV